MKAGKKISGLGHRPLEEPSFEDSRWEEHLGY
jgi:hypothetical protein